MELVIENYTNIHTNKISNVKVKRTTGEIIDLYFENIYDSRALAYYNGKWIKCHWFFDDNTNYHVGFSLIKTLDNMIDFEEKIFPKESIKKYEFDIEENTNIWECVKCMNRNYKSTDCWYCKSWICMNCTVANSCDSYICSICTNKNQELADMCDYWICSNCTIKNNNDTYECSVCCTMYDEEEEEQDDSDDPDYEGDEYNIPDTFTMKLRSQNKLCCLCDENSSDTIICYANKHILCNECFEGNLMNQIGSEYNKHFKDHDMKIVCEMCRVNPTETDRTISKYTDKDVVCHVSEETYEKYRKACFDIIHVKAANETETRLKKQFEEQPDFFPKQKKQKNNNISMHRNHIIENILTLKCTSCDAAFLDFAGCFALTCNNCDANFCGWCLENCNDMDSCHKHVLYCDYSKEYGSLFSSLELFKECHNEWRYDMITDYINTKVKKADRHKVRKAIEDDLYDIGM
jgi:hypothetical protein